MNVNEMTAAECADWRAKKDGWSFEYNASKFKWWKPCQLIMPSGQPSPFLARTWSSHPYPLTLDGAAAALPEGLYVSVNHFCDSIRTDVDLWEAATVKNGAYIAGTGPDEMTARYRLAVACCMAQRDPMVERIKRIERTLNP